MKKKNLRNIYTLIYEYDKLNERLQRNRYYYFGKIILSSVFSLIITLFNLLFSFFDKIPKVSFFIILIIIFIVKKNGIIRTRDKWNWSKIKKILKLDDIFDFNIIILVMLSSVSAINEHFKIYKEIEIHFIYFVFLFALMLMWLQLISLKIALDTEIEQYKDDNRIKSIFNDIKLEKYNFKIPLRKIHNIQINHINNLFNYEIRKKYEIKNSNIEYLEKEFIKIKKEEYNNKNVVINFLKKNGGGVILSLWVSSLVNSYYSSLFNNFQNKENIALIQELFLKQIFVISMIIALVYFLNFYIYRGKTPILEKLEVIEECMDKLLCEKEQ